MDLKSASSSNSDGGGPICREGVTLVLGPAYGGWLFRKSKGSGGGYNGATNSQESVLLRRSQICPSSPYDYLDLGRERQQADCRTVLGDEWYCGRWCGVRPEGLVDGDPYAHRL